MDRVLTRKQVAAFLGIEPGTLECRFGTLYKLSNEDRRKVCQEIAEACEKSFRRGFHQGREGAEDVVVDVVDWRFNTPLSDSPSPHGTYDCDAITRHANEVELPRR